MQEPKIEDRYYRALLERDPTYLGSFFAGVKTTGVFCISTCSARKPKRENVEFFDSFKSAMDHGYRPCKICRPTENAHQAPPDVERAIKLVRAHPKEKISDALLRGQGIAPEKTRRWFKRNYGMTFHGYQRMYRINHAMIELRNGRTATDVAFDAGYESLSGFGYTFKRSIGRAPRDSHEVGQILIDRFTTPLGPMFACATSIGLCLLEFVDRRMLETEFENLQKRLNARILPGENEIIQQAREEIAEYFSGARRKFTVPLHTPGTEFQNRVWTALREIPFGCTSTYQGQAEALGNRNAVRAVARANGMNRVAIIIPCHRVVGKDGSLVGYAGGLERKRRLLNHEQGGVEG
ncbi:MAG: bifunctional transcriptional activator/DNA repair enzyme AdaA [Alkalispirochaeta sp.]